MKNSLEENNGMIFVHNLPLISQKPNFDELTDDKKNALRQQVSLFLRRRCQQLLPLILDIDEVIRHPSLVDQHVDRLIGARKIKRGARTAIFSRMSELREMLSHVIHVDRTVASSKNISREAQEQGRKQADIEWTCQSVWPALKELADSGLQDWDALRKLSAKLPYEHRQPWRDVINETKMDALKQGDGVDADDAPSDQSRFVLALKSLNERWFMQRNKFLMRCPRKSIRYSVEGEEAPPLWEYVKVGVHTVEAIQTYQFHDHSIPVVYMRSLFPLPPEIEPHVAYDGIQGYVVMTRNELEGNIHTLRALHESITHPNPDVEIAMHTGGETPASIAGWKEYAGIVASQYEDANRMYGDMEVRTLLEELRHGIDAKRVRRLIGEHVGQDYYPKFADALLTQNGQMRQVFNACDERAKALFGSSLSELSAQMTAAALSSNHTLMIAEWRKYMVEWSHPNFDPNVPQGLSHANASTWALLLLAQELGMIPPPTVEPERPSIWTRVKRLVTGQQRPLSFADPNHRHLLNIADELLLKPAAQVRCALKKVYGREFTLGSIDEFPFHEITQEGELKSHQQEHG